jgi:hypothetical protein
MPARDDAVGGLVQLGRPTGPAPTTMTFMTILLDTVFAVRN